MLNKIALVESDFARTGKPRATNPEHSLRVVPDPDLRTLAVQAKLIRKVQRARSRRVEFLGSSLFGEPAWDMLLELFASAAEQKRLTVGDLCKASKVPPTTALRWIDALFRQGLITRRPDPLDSRRVHVEIADGAHSAMRAYAEQLSNILTAD